MLDREPSLPTVTLRTAESHTWIGIAAQFIPTPTPPPTPPPTDDHHHYQGHHSYYHHVAPELPRHRAGGLPFPVDVRLPARPPRAPRSGPRLPADARLRQPRGPPQERGGHGRRVLGGAWASRAVGVGVCMQECVLTPLPRVLRQGEWVCADCGYIYDKDDCGGLAFEQQKCVHSGDRAKPQWTSALSGSID